MEGFYISAILVLYGGFTLRIWGDQSADPSALPSALISTALLSTLIHQCNQECMENNVLVERLGAVQGATSIIHSGSFSLLLGKQ